MPAQEQESIKKLAGLSVDHAIATVKHSLEGQWTGLFPDGVKAPKQSSASGGNGRFDGVSRKGGE